MLYVDCSLFFFKPYICLNREFPSHTPTLSMVLHVQHSGIAGKIPSLWALSYHNLHIWLLRGGRRCTKPAFLEEEVPNKGRFALRLPAAYLLLCEKRWQYAPLSLFQVIKACPSIIWILNKGALLVRFEHLLMQASYLFTWEVDKGFKCYISAFPKRMCNISA